MRSKKLSGKFFSSGDGIISENFYVGNNITRNADFIEVRNSSSVILSIPKSGLYKARLSNQPFQVFNNQQGGIMFPDDMVYYKAITNEVNDLIIIISMEDIEATLKKKYDLKGLVSSYLKLEMKKEEVSSAINFIESTLQLARNFPQLRESLLIKSNIKEIATLMVSDLIANALNAKPATSRSIDSYLVRETEEYIEREAEKIFTIHDLASHLNTTPRTLQMAFKKHRDYSPMQYLKNQKFYKARKLLLSNNSPQLSIKTAAMMAGIPDLSRFSTYYQEKFGELPSETLKKSRG